MSTELPTLSVSLHELSAWCRASLLMAQREGFPLVAARVSADLAKLDAMRDAGIQSVTVVSGPRLEWCECGHDKDSHYLECCACPCDSFQQKEI